MSRVLRPSSAPKRSNPEDGRHSGAKNQGRQGLYPTADLQRTEIMKAKFFYTGIRVKDLEASVKFYTAILGMKVRGRNTIEAEKGWTTSPSWSRISTPRSRRRRRRAIRRS